MTLLEIKCLSRSFGGVKAVQQVDLSLEQGRISAIIGPNGAGKSTLFNLITGMDKADSGTVTLAGRDITGMASHRINRLGIGRTFQNIRLFKELSVAENVLVGCHAHNPSPHRWWTAISSLIHYRREDQLLWRKTCRWLEFFQLYQLRNELAASLPYGKQRELELARALAGEPQLLFLDEPAAGMNPQETIELMANIRRIVELGITVALIDHDMKLVMNISQHIAVLNFGCKIAEGTPQQVQRHPEVIRAYLGDEP